MAKQTVNIGSAVNDGSGDPARTAFNKLNLNNNEIYNYLGDGINLNKLGTAAFKNVGTQAGNVMQVGAFGLGTMTSPLYNEDVHLIPSGFFRYADESPHRPSLMGYYDNYGFNFTRHASGFGAAFFFPYYAYSAKQICLRTFGGTSYSDYYLRHSQNTTVDGNGFLKNASPIVQLFANKIELNDEAQQQSIEFEKLGAGDYLIKGSSGFAQDGWYIETPKDANGNLLVAVVYEQLENGDISVKTYDYMLNNKGRIVVDTETPLDIPESRWIDIRLQELPQPEIEIPESIAPPDFQHAGLAEAVATVMESYHDPEQ